VTGQLTPGQTYQLRVAEVNNQGIFNLGIDNISITAGTPILEPESVLLWGIGLAAISAIRRREWFMPRKIEGVN